jgi:hypothetical protein
MRVGSPKTGEAPLDIDGLPKAKLAEKLEEYDAGRSYSYS